MTNQTKNKNFLKSGWDEFLMIFSNKKVILTIFVTLGILVLFRIGSVIPMPFIKLNNNQFGESNSFLQIMNLLGGGGLSQFSIFAIGISPYITAQIIVQLLSSDLIPPLARLTKSGEKGRKKIEVITRLLTLPFAIVQSYAIITMILNSSNSFISISSNLPLVRGSAGFFVFYIVLMISGTYISILLGDLISKRGVGNGMTLIILTGIIASLFNSFQTVFNSLTNVAAQNSDLITLISFVVYLFFYFLVLIGVIFIDSSVRKIPIQQVGQSFNRDSKELSYLPIKINSASVIPVIFASSLMTIPTTIAQLLPQSSASVTIINRYLSLDSISGVIFYFFLIILFTFFYSYVQLNPNKISEDFKKSGRFIPGVKVGVETEKHISKILYRVNWIGGPFLALIASLPYIVTMVTTSVSGGAIRIPSYASLGGTGIVIMVSGTIELWGSIKSTAKTSNYTYQKKEIAQSLTNIINNTNNDNDNDSQLW